MQYFVYILTTVNNTALYIGVTNSLTRRISEHKNEMHDGFSQKYKTCKLVYYETTGDVKAAITREKQLKGWRREKKTETYNGIQSRMGRFIYSLKNSRALDNARELSR